MKVESSEGMSQHWPQVSMCIHIDMDTHTPKPKPNNKKTLNNIVPTSRHFLDSL